MALGLQPIEIVAMGTYSLLAKADHWKRVILCHVAKVHNGFAFKSSYFDTDRGVPLIRIRDISKDETEHSYWGEYDDGYLVKTGEILIGMDGDFSASRWKGEEALLNQRVCKVTLLSDLFDEDFLYLCLQPFLDAINAETSSVTVKHLSSKTIEEIPLPLPPLKEQRRIVAKIEELFSELDKGVESLKTAQEQLNIHRQAVLKHAFEGKITAQWREENKDKLETPEQLLARIKQERAARYGRQLQEWKAAVKEWEGTGEREKKPIKPKRPRGFSIFSQTQSLIGLWPVFELGDLISVSSGQSLTLNNMRNGQYPVYGGNGICGYHDEYSVSEPTLIIGRVGAKCGITHITTANSWVTDNALIASPLIRSFSKHYFLYLLEYQNLNTLGSSTGQPVISGGKIYPVQVPLPTLAEQEKIADSIEKTQSSIEDLKVEIENQLIRANALRQSILKKAFSGQLVAQNSHDEPASVILERIKAEREQA